MKKNIKTLTKYLIHKDVQSLLKIQKILFLLRVEEISSSQKHSFFKPNHNFQAWIFGPVNVKSYYYTQRFYSIDHKRKIKPFLTKQSIKIIDNIFGEWFEKYNKLDSTELKELSQRNKSWLIARKGLQPNDFCKNFLEEDYTFLEFNKKK